MPCTTDLNRPYRGAHGVIRYNVYTDLFIVTVLLLYEMIN